MKFSAFVLCVTLAVCSICATFVAEARGDDWPSWRGPHQNGIAAPGDYPVEWDEEQNVAWKADIPGWGTSTPVICRGRIFASFADEERNGLVCFDTSGRQLWMERFGPAAKNRNQKASGANPSPVTDGDRVYAYFKSGEVVCVDRDGNRQWDFNTQTAYGPDALWWDLGTSPVLTRDSVVIAVMHQGPSYLVALDKKTGSVRWKHDRNVEAPGEARDSYTTPLVIEDNGQEQIIVLGADHVTAHDAATGEEIWRVSGLNPRRQGNFRSIASPVVADGVLFAPYERGRSLTAIRLGGKGDVTQTHVLWKAESLASDVPCPIAAGGRVYSCSDRGDVSCLDASNGNVIWTHRLPRSRHSYSASPVMAGTRLYLTREDGMTFVLDVADEPTLLAENFLNEYTYASPVLVDNRVYIRTSKYLVCIGK